MSDASTRYRAVDAKASATRRSEIREKAVDTAAISFLFAVGLVLYCVLCPPARAAEVAEPITLGATIGMGFMLSVFGWLIFGLIVAGWSIISAKDMPDDTEPHGDPVGYRKEGRS